MTEPTCPYHHETIKELAEATAAIKAQSDIMRLTQGDITSIFDTYLHDFNTDLKRAGKQLDALVTHSRHHGEVVAGLVLRLDAHIKEYQVLCVEFNEFRWFRNMLNKIKNSPAAWVTTTVFFLLFIINCLPNEYEARVWSWLIKKASGG